MARRVARAFVKTQVSQTASASRYSETNPYWIARRVSTALTVDNNVTKTVSPITPWIGAGMRGDTRPEANVTSIRTAKMTSTGAGSVRTAASRANPGPEEDERLREGQRGDYPDGHDSVRQDRREAALLEWAAERGRDDQDPRNPTP